MQTTLSIEGDGIKNINGGPLSRELLFIRTPKTRILFLPMCTYVLARPSRGGIGGANVRRYSRFSFARLPIHLVASYHDRPSIQVHRCVLVHITGVSSVQVSWIFRSASSPLRLAYKYQAAWITMLRGRCTLLFFSSTEYRKLYRVKSKLVAVIRILDETKPESIDLVHWYLLFRPCKKPRSTSGYRKNVPRRSQYRAG